MSRCTLFKMTSNNVEDNNNSIYSMFVNQSCKDKILKWNKINVTWLMMGRGEESDAETLKWNDKNHILEKAVYSTVS